MTTPQPKTVVPDVERIAAGLTKAQRAWLLGEAGRHNASTQCLCDEQGLSEMRPISALRGKRVLTLLGTQVRQHLIEKAKA